EIGYAEIEPPARVSDDLVDRARELFAEASRLVVAGAPRHRIMDQVERAAALCPRDPGYRFLAGAWRLDQGWPRRAMAHFEAALEIESIPYRRAQALLWGARAADAAG